MSKLIIKTNFWGALAIVGVTLLSGCGESTNIEGEATGNVSACSSLLGVTCVTGRLIDDAAFNVDYECGLPGSGTVRSVTASDGSFVCPNGSVVTFALINPDSSTHRITLGSLTVSRPAKVYGDNPAMPVYFYVTPRHLAGDGVGEPNSTKALNITRLLQTLSDDPIDATLTGHLPTRRIIISDDDKRKIVAGIFPDEFDLSASIASDPANPGAATFDFYIKDYLQSLTNASKHQLISGAAAAKSLQKGINNTVAGIYLVPGGSVLSTGSLVPGSTSFDADTGAMVGYDAGSGKSFVGAFYMLVDRRGRTFGHGVYSYGASLTSEPWTVWSDPQAMELSVTGDEISGMKLWPNDGDLTPFRFMLRGSSDTGKQVQIEQGVMRREAIAGSSNIYSNLFDESASSSALGLWSLGDGSTITYISSGAYTLEHTVAVATWMNPDIWTDSVVEFPLPITVSVYNRDYDNGACPGARGCKIADIRMVILEDGNIISDRYQTCGVDVDPETLVVNGNILNQEIPLGVVANALNTVTDETTTAMKTMTLLAMLPGDSRLNDTMTVTPGYEDYLPYLQFGSNLGENSLLRLDGVTNKFQLYGYCSAALATLDLCDFPTTYQPAVASWANGYTFMRAIKANKAAPSAPATAALIDNIGGVMTAQRTPGCPL